MISINATLVVQIINFLVLIWILNRILFRPIFRIIEEREKSVESSRADMRRLKTSSEEKIKACEVQLKEARTAAAVHKEEIRGQAAVQARQIMEQARTQAQEHISAIQTEVAIEAERAKADLADFKESIVRLVFTKVMGREG
ncbi:MAG: ATP synthase F0 subunit B [Deltaproteobacteria bacterium]|nr:ATP synthase F0 subunit B [Deltaproteobacteria bacterium]MBW2086071.1 ATP synthase F0 subunit B [Deltaproteobacteria bacterium]